ncbi:hypothetical protein SAMN04488063_2351 [Halopelagius inordinatus]|uniref:Uncharacterized protein n=1 Tax=Halopelagius inordinatus TaxID=553467 RepID=A0A1I2SMX7_9EURY|nr:hypothetical protein [Halopelagius inordinatus]SFG53973.1 hypothetical protein SAMN04488063_2351 [Halopelagius inordinatus]
MNRRLFLVPGVVVLFGLALFVAAFGPPAAPSGVAAVSCFAAAGVAFLLSGLRESIRVGSSSVPWYVLAGVGDVALALGLLVNGVVMVTHGGGTLVTALPVAGSALFLLFVGADYIRGGVHFDVSVFE